MLNQNLYRIEQQNAFSRVTRTIREFREAHPDVNLVSLGIGDVSKPVCKPIIDAMHKAVDDCATMDNFVGYGNYFGLPELRKTICDNEYSKFGFTPDEIYIGDGTKTDTTNILELFDKNSKILISEMIYPIYLNGSLALSGNIFAGEVDDSFKMIIPDEHYDLVYLCSPNNPTGDALSFDEITKWVKYALKENAVLLIDNVYCEFIQDKNVPKSVYEIPDADKCAIEFRSFSKTASFTGLRVSYYVLPHKLGVDAISLWRERTVNRFNGASYVAQKGAIASFLPESRRIIASNISGYLENAVFLREEFIKLGYEVIGGINAPYLWIKADIDSWDFFGYCINHLHVIVTPGAVFGPKGNKYFRVSALGTIENSIEAIERFKKVS